MKMFTIRVEIQSRLGDVQCRQRMAFSIPEPHLLKVKDFALGVRDMTRAMCLGNAEVIELWYDHPERYARIQFDPKSNYPI